MTTAQVFLIGMIAACIPSLLFVTCMLLKASKVEEECC